MEFNENFIEVEAGDITKKWQSIYAYNILTARMIPELIDGLKPVVRRALYMMYQKDGGKTFRKVLAISGDTIGKVHPHSDVSVQSAIVGNAQWWNNSVPLIEGSGNFGSCVDPETEILIMDENSYIVKWMKFPDFADDPDNKLVASVNPDTGEWRWEAPTGIIRYGYKGKMITGKNPAPNKFADFKVTPDHKMVCKQISGVGSSDKYEFVNAEKVPDVFQPKIQDVKPNDNARGYNEWKMLPIKAFEKYGLWQEGVNYKSPDDEIWAVSLFGAEVLPLKVAFKVISVFLGYGIFTDKNRVLVPNDIEKYVDLSDIEDIIGSPYEENGMKFLDGEEFIGFLNENEEPKVPEPESPDDPIDPYDSHIPGPIFYMNEENINTFMETYGECTKSDPLNMKCMAKSTVYQFQALATMIGKFTAIGQTTPDSENPTAKEQAGVWSWILNCKPNFEPRIEKESSISEDEDYDDEVFCVTMPSFHTFICRRNEVVMLTGNCSGDCAGAPRYIKARLSDYAIACFFEDWKDSVVDMQLAYDEETMMPDYLPAKYPNVLINGCLGIAYGFSVRIPSFNFREVIEATIMLIHNPNSNIILIPDSPTGADIIEADFGSICNRGKGSYMQRCKYSIDPESNTITITALPEQSTANSVRETIANIKEKGGLTELLAMNDLSGAEINIQLVIRDDVNPYKFMKKLISQVAGLEQSYPVSVMVTTDYMIFEYSIKQVLLEWLKWRREQKRVALSNKRGTLYGEQRVNDIKLFIMNPKNLNDTLDIFRHSHNRQEIEDKLIAKYRKTEIMMDSVQARALSNMRMIELTIDAYEEYKKRAEEIKNELAEIEEILNTENGVDKVIIAELRDGIKRFGKPRRSNVVPYAISVSNEVDGYCILQLSSDGNIIRTPASNAEEEPIPTDSNGFACLVDNDASFILVDDMGYHTFIRVKELPVNTEVPVFRYSKKPLDGKVVAMLPYDIESDKCCTLISKQGIVKRIRIPEIGPSKKPIITIDKEDRIVKGIVLKSKSQKDLLIYTKNGMGQRLDPNSIRITSPSAKGINGFKLKKDDEICGVYSISPEANAYLLYVTTKGKARLNLIDYLPTRESKHDDMVQLITLNDRDKLVAVVGCNKLDKATVYYDDSDSEVIDIKKLPESTMSSEPKKVTQKNAVSNNITKVKIN